MAAAVAVIIRKQREIVALFQGAGATSPEKARDPGELGVDDGVVFQGLVRRSILRPGDGARFYVDLPAWEAHNTMRRRRAVIILVAIVAALAAALATSLVRFS